MGRRAGQNMVRGTGAASYTYLATAYTALGIRARPTRPTRPAQARLFVRLVGSTARDSTGLCPADKVANKHEHAYIDVLFLIN
jgi:hypothetical protein